MAVDSKIKDLLKKNINIKGLVSDAIDGIVEPALKAAVEKSDNKIDDLIMNALYPLVELEIKKQIEANLDWDKILG